MSIPESARATLRQQFIGNQELLLAFSEFCDLQAQFWAMHALSELIKAEGKVDWQSVIRSAARYDVWINIVGTIEAETKHPDTPRGVG